MKLCINFLCDRLRRLRRLACLPPLNIRTTTTRHRISRIHRVPREKVVAQPSGCSTPFHSGFSLVRVYAACFFHTTNSQ